MKFKKSISFVLTLCMVLSLFATFVIPASAEPTNLVAGSSNYTTSQLFRQDESYAWNPESPITYPDEDGKSLTDGVKEAANFWDAAWVGFSARCPEYQEIEHSYVTFDLGAVCEISSIVLYTFADSASGIAAPYWVNYCVSEDGENWSEIGYVDNGAGDLVITFEKEASARFVKVKIYEYGWCFLSEVEIYGTAPVVEDPDVSVEPATIVPTTLNSYAWTADTEILLSTMSDSSKTVVDALGGEWFQYWTHVVADWSEDEGAFVVSEIQINVTDYVTTNLGEGRIVLSAWCDNATESAENLRALAVGDKLYLDGDFASLVDGTGAISGYTLSVNAPLAGDEDTEVPVELPEDATVIDYLGYIHDAYSMVAYAEADMTLGELVAKYLGQSKDLNYCKVAICDGDGTVVAVYLTLSRPDGVKTDFTISAGQFAVIYNANKAGHEVMDGINVGDTITLYNVDALESHTGTAVALENAGFTVEAAPAAPEAGLAGANVSQWAAGAGFDVLTDGYNGVGEVDNYDPYMSKLFGVASGVMEATDYTLTFVVDEQDINTITLYALDFANGGVMLPDAVIFVVNGVEYEAVINANENGIATIVAELGETVTADTIVANVAMGASPYTFAIFNMFTEFETSLVEAPVVPALPFEDGDNVVITYPADNLAISAEEDVYNNKYRLAGTDVANGAVFTVDITDDGIYFICNGKYLTSGATGNNLTLEDEASEYSLWVLEEAENGWYIKNVNAAYNGNAQYIEYYFAFTTYGFNASKADIYTFQFDVQEAPELNEVEGGELPAHNPRAGSLSIAANTAITYTVAFEHGANFNLWSEDVTVLVNGEALEMGMLGYVAILAKGDTVTIVNAGAEAVEIYPSIAPVIPGTMSSPIVLDELGDITANVTEDIVMDNGAVFYTYTVPENGTLTITMPEGNWTYTVNNLTAGLYGDTQWSDSEDSSATTSIEVSAGDEIQIIVGTYNPDEPWTAPVGELTFNAAFEAAKVTSNVVTDWNTSNWGGADEAHIFTNQEAYLACTHTWWSHVSFKPTNYEGVYEVVAIRGATGEAAAYEIAEGGFIWLAHDTAAEGTAGAYAHALIKTLAVGDLVKFTGIDVANCTTTEDATAEKWEAPKAPDVVDLKVSHNNLYNWGTFESMIISQPGKTVVDVISQTPYWWIMYVVEEVDGVYVATAYYKNCDEINTTVCPENGFLYYVYSDNSAWEVADEGKLLGYIFNLNDIDLSANMAIDTNVNPGDVKYITALNPEALKAGDVNKNGEIDATDYAIIRKLVLGTLTAEDIGDLAYSLADVNGDGKVNARDYYLVKRAFLGTYVIPGWEVEEDEAE